MVHNLDQILLNVVLVEAGEFLQLISGVPLKLLLQPLSLQSSLLQLFLLGLFFNDLLLLLTHLLFGNAASGWLLL